MFSQITQYPSLFHVFLLAAECFVTCINIEQRPSDYVNFNFNLRLELYNVYLFLK